MYRFYISLVEGFRIAITALWANKVRAMLTTTCIVIGIVSVTTMNTVTNGVDRAFEDSMDMLGRNVVYVEKWPWGFGGEYKWWEYRNRRELQQSYAPELRRLVPRAVNVGTMAYASSTIRYGERATERVVVLGGSSTYFDITGVTIEHGRAFSEEEEHRGARVVVLGHSVAESLFGDGDGIGREVRIRGQRFIVIGVVEKRGSFLGMEDLDTMMMMPISAFGPIFGLRNGVRLAVQFANDVEAVEGEYEVIGAMRQIRGLDPMDADDFSINKAALFEEQFKGMKTAIYGIGIFLTGLALFVGGIGVMNIMFVSVKERTREIGIRKAIGAKSWEILLQFLVESIIICLLGGLIGMLLSIGVTHLMNQIFVAYLDWGTVVNAILICAFIGILFGYLPSSRAAKSTPIESLRYE